MEDRENQNQEQNQGQTSDISKSQSAQQPNFDRKDETGEAAQQPESGQPGFDQSGDTLAQQKQKTETDSAESLETRGEEESGFVGTGEQDGSDELIDREKQSDGE